MSSESSIGEREMGPHWVNSSRQLPCGTPELGKLVAIQAEETNPGERILVGGWGSGWGSSSQDRGLMLGFWQQVCEDP